ncbi:hypothetical protein Anas_05594 [Armadillidium nasatum]|uniref:Uncharacterized protein n=1 Tax=Armadillidium nasatum TaxID=96803 RepID=A0A5N5ST05_9CRUS|nr:hypothetical protein Anas_05594 [Armadillidium nasatum]
MLRLSAQKAIRENVMFRIFLIVSILIILVVRGTMLFDNTVTESNALLSYETYFWLLICSSLN